MVAPPPKLKSGIKSNKESLEREIRERENCDRIIVHCFRKTYLSHDFKDHL